MSTALYLKMTPSPKDEFINIIIFYKLDFNPGQHLDARYISVNESYPFQYLNTLRVYGIASGFNRRF